MKVDNTTVKTHICPACGGNLKIDPERQMYECAFCGVTFDYEYFREDEVLNMADRALSIGETDSAKRAYEFMLQKDPKNFFAIRGLLLISIKIRSVSELGLTETYRKRNFSNVVRRLGRFKGEVDPDYKEYFSSMTNLVKTGRKAVAEEIKSEECRESKLSALVDYEEQGFSYNDLTDDKLKGFGGRLRRLSKTLLKNFVIYLGIVALIFLVIKAPSSKRTVMENAKTKNEVVLDTTGNEKDDIIAREKQEAANRAEVIERQKNDGINNRSELQKIQDILKNDNLILYGALAIPTGLFVLICGRELTDCWLFRRRLKEARQRYADLVTRYEAQEDYVNELKKEMRSYYLEMKKFEKSLA